MIGQVFKWIFLLVLLIFLVILGYAIFGDFSVPEKELRQPVILDVD